MISLCGNVNSALEIMAQGMVGIFVTIIIIMLIIWACSKILYKREYTEVKRRDER